MIMAPMNSVQCSAFTNDMLIAPKEPLPMLMSHLDPPEASVYHAANVRILQFLLVVFDLLCDVRIGKSVMEKCIQDISHFLILHVKLTHLSMDEVASDIKDINFKRKLFCQDMSFVTMACADVIFIPTRRHLCIMLPMSIASGWCYQMIEYHMI